MRETQAGHWGEHVLEEHLQAVAQLANQFATPFGSGDWAYLAGLWHDLGKYRLAFQHYIRSASGYDPDAHIEVPGRVDHSTVGALYACKQLGPEGRILAYLIAGHHAGLPDWQSVEAGRKALAHRLRPEQQSFLDEALSQPIPEAILQVASPISRPRGRDIALWIRMLFSCLVDADFLDTESFMDGDKTAARSGYPSLSELLSSFECYIEGLQKGARSTPVNRLRAEILNRCRGQAIQPPGLFSLTVPTGGGKTLSSLAFALHHARAYDKRRIIYVIPYTSIIEQTANVFRQIFGDAVLEHHSNLDSDHEDARSRLACENWDAPIVVTTSVQFFESLFAARTSRVRKLHNIINSVVVLDEVQLLPPDFLKPILHAIRELAKNYQVSFMLCTATQPALESRQGFDSSFEGLEGVQEIMDGPQALHEALRRVEVTVPDDLHDSTAWEELAEELHGYDSVLCIVDRRDDCRTLHRLMPRGTLHLSGLMCGQHRSEVIAEIKQRLKAGEPVRVVSTQLVEAGVDVDFPVVYRALAGLDSIAQAAGRCNREGLLEGKGKVVVFIPPKQAPVGHLRQAQDCGRQILQQRPPDPLAPEHFITYFQQLYWKKGTEGLDRKGILKDLKHNGQLRFLFSSAAAKFRLIDETQQAPVIVRYGKGVDLIEQLRHLGPKRWLLRKLQRYVVNLPRYRHQQLLNQGDIQEIHPGLFIQAHDGLYHQDLGLLGDDPAYYDPDQLIV
ncbi:CRISPR-associated helicase Cas3 [Nitrosococcus halophilus Nc 4]|uniref:CRISPR-associated helicase Cas3 n=1 Tax=Nitrosococcus halophilus (strain Nc4) TaxID=472759 RepID=D5C3S7_NITHN|nr:CRISPR-associated helicase/endonuclease Cas3 [Nitrosococcus halophilus]ADE15049.1 CRISPR-associated helicase Cas3 [Nitrosococcus halophilus Nc 4]